MIHLSKNARVMVIAAHPDDELLGCGATVHRWTALGAEAHALILAQGLAARGEDNQNNLDEKIKNLRNNARKAAEIIGYKSVSFEDFPDNQMDSVSMLKVVKSVSHHAGKINPDVVLTHHHGDLNVDHRIVYQAVITAFRPLAGSNVNTVLCFETPSSTEWNFPYYKNTFSPNVFINVDNHMDAKIAALHSYESEVQRPPHPRSPEIVRAISQRWGSVAGQDNIEAFELVLARVR